MCRFHGLAILFLTMLPLMAMAQTPSGPPMDILCEHAPKGAVLPLPALVSDWVTVICTPRGQALAPEIKKYKSIWITPVNGQPFALYAAPPDWPKSTLSIYDLRFASFSTVERTGEAREKTLAMWDLGFGPAPRPAIDRIVQLDAYSAIGGTMYNLFFYTIGDEPRWIIICRDACKQSVQIVVQAP